MQSVVTLGVQSVVAIIATNTYFIANADINNLS